MFRKSASLKCLLLILLLGALLPDGVQAATKSKSKTDPLIELSRLVKLNPKPFVVVSAFSENTKKGRIFGIRGQGVVVDERGYVLSAAHISWNDGKRVFANDFQISFRGAEAAKPSHRLPGGVVHTHRTAFGDREGEIFIEHKYGASLMKNGGTRFIHKGDLGLFKIRLPSNKKTKVKHKPFPKIDFYSEKPVSLKSGEKLYLCHYNFPHNDGDPTFLINPVEVVGVTQTPHGFQYLAKGYYRWGSSGGAILKDGKLIGIQSAAYTVNAKDIGEVPLGLISFQVVWKDMIKGMIK